MTNGSNLTLQIVIQFRFTLTKAENFVPENLILVTKGGFIK